MVLYGQEYDYRGSPELARLIETVAVEQGVLSKAIDAATLPRHYATINVVNKLCRGEKVVSVSTCQNCRPKHYLQSGCVIGEAIRRSEARVVLLASGALEPQVQRDRLGATACADLRRAQRGASRKHRARQGSGRAVRGRPSRPHPRAVGRQVPPPAVEGFGAHYLQMVGALGGPECRALGTRCSDTKTPAARATSMSGSTSK